MEQAVNSLESRDVLYHLHPFTDAARHLEAGPKIFVRGEGIYVFDNQGKKYIEGLSGLWCASLGFSEKRLVAAAMKQLETLPFYHNFAHKAVAPTIELAEALIKRSPVPMSKVFFTNSGSEANDTQVKLVWYYNNILGRAKKKKIISRRGAYHGITVATGSMTGLVHSHNAFDLPLPGFLHTDFPHYYRYSEAGESEVAYSERLARNLEDLIRKEGADTIGGFIAEPFIGAGGVVPPPNGYFERIQPILKHYEILFIVDEVISGFFRTGKMFGTQTYKLEPDLITLAKSLSAAYQPIGAVLISEKVWRTIVEGSRKYGTFGTGFTYSGHPVPAAVALATLRIYEEDRIEEHVRTIIPHFQERLRKLSERSIVGDARGVGLVGAIELVKDKTCKTTFDPAQQVATWIMDKAFEHGLIVRALPNDTVAVCPPLIIQRREIDDLFDRFERTLEDAEVEFGTERTTSLPAIG